MICGIGAGSSAITCGSGLGNDPSKRLSFSPHWPSYKEEFTERQIVKVPKERKDIKYTG
jgi:hypothetical protein